MRLALSVYPQYNSVYTNLGLISCPDQLHSCAQLVAQVLSWPKTIGMNISNLLCFLSMRIAIRLLEALDVWEEGFHKGTNIVQEGKRAEMYNLGLGNRVCPLRQHIALSINPNRMRGAWSRLRSGSSCWSKRTRTIRRFGRGKETTSPFLTTATRASSSCSMFSS